MSAAVEPFVVDAPSGRLPAERWPGAPPPVVLLHAGVADRRAWAGVAPLLANRGHAVITYDRRGFGGAAEAATDPAFTHLDDLAAVLDAAGAERAWLVGSSMGGVLAVDFALVAPARVAGLVLLAALVSGFPEAEDPELDPETAALDARLEAATDPDEANRWETWLWLDGPQQPEGRVGGAARELALDMNRIALESEVPETAGAGAVAAWERLGELTVPVTVAWGELDVPLVIDQVHAVAARIPGARTEALPGTAHLPYLEQPALVADLIERSLARAGGVAAGRRDDDEAE